MGESPVSETTRGPSATLLRLLRAGRDRYHGVLSIRPRDGDGPTLHLLLETGLLCDLETDGEASLLGRALMSSPSLRDRDRRRLQKEQAAGHRDAGRMAIEEGFLEENEIARCIVEGLDQEFSRILSYDDPEIVESPHAPFNSGLLGCIELSLAMDEALLRGATFADRWDAARELPLLREVFYATPQALEIFRAPDQFPEDAAILPHFDGRLDLAEVIEHAELDPWTTIARVRNLAADGFLEPTNPVQLFQSGCDEERAGSLGKALRLFQHADELGLDDFDLGFRLAEVLQRVGRTQEAVGHFRAFAEKCVGQFRIEDTIQCYAHILELDPDDLAVQEKYLTLLARYGRSDEALSSSVELARRLQAAGDEARARRLMEKIVENADRNEEVLRVYRDLCLATADPEGASRASDKLGALLLERDDLAGALEVYQELFFQAQENTTVRSRLVELHFRLGNAEKAGEHLDALTELSGWNASHPSEEAVQFHRRLLDLGIEDSRITAWLSEAARGQESREDSAHYLERHRDLLREAGDIEGARLAAAELQRLRPDDIGTARTLADLERRCGHASRAGVVLEDLVVRLAEAPARPPVAEWRSLLEELLVLAPHSAIARKLWLRALPDAGEEALRDRLHLESALLCLATGEIEEARANLARLAPPPPLAPVIELCAGILARGGRKVGAEAPASFRRGAQQAVESGDRALVADLADRLEKVAPSDPDVAKLRADAERLRSPDAPALGRSQPVMKSSVAGITEKLRGLKDGSAPEPGRAAAPQAGGAVNSALARLKGLKGGAPPAMPAAAPDADAGTPASGDAAAAATGPRPSAVPAAAAGKSALAGLAPLPPPPSPKAAGTGVHSALARLRGLQGGAPAAPTTPHPVPEAGDAPAAASSPAGAAGGKSAGADAQAPLPPPPAPDRAGGGVNSALARLRGLKGGGAPSPAADVAPAADAPVPSPEGGASAPTKKGGAAELGALPPPPPPEKGKKLGGVASRLSALRDAGGKGG